MKTLLDPAATTKIRIRMRIMWARISKIEHDNLLITQSCNHVIMFTPRLAMEPPPSSNHAIRASSRSTRQHDINYQHGVSSRLAELVTR